MKKIIVFAIIICTTITLNWVKSSSDDAKKDGKTICIDAKCNMCHGLAKAEIEVKNKNSKAPDLGTIDMKDKSEFMMKFLVKEETMNDKKHPVKFGGSTDDLKILVDWLVVINKPDTQK
jgi:hypothetical protein